MGINVNFIIYEVIYKYLYSLGGIWIQFHSLWTI